MTISEWLTTKPAQIRIGQHFVNCFCTKSEKTTQRLFQLDGELAIRYIKVLMEDWQWDSLPEFKNPYESKS